MTVTTPPAPPAPPRAALPAASRYTASVQRARRLLWIMLIAMGVLGLLTTIASALAAQDALSRYRAIVADSTLSADAAQEARAALLDYHNQAALFLAGPDAEPPSEAAWGSYQRALRQIWANRPAAEPFGENATFEALDQATLRYRAQLDVMQAFQARDEGPAAREAFLAGHEILIREALPALNGIETLKLNNMEAAYATTRTSVTRGQTLFGIVGAALLLLLGGAYLTTRWWMRYRWTWEIALATVGALLLFLWFNTSLWYAATSVESLVRGSYDSISATQSVEALLAQSRAMEGLALLDPTSEAAQDYLSDGDEYFFLLQQRLCGEPQPSCLDAPFTTDNKTITRDALTVATQGQGKYALPQPPLVANVTRAAEIQPLEALRQALVRYRDVGMTLRAAIEAGRGAPSAYRVESQTAYDEALAASASELAAVRGGFDSLYRTVTLGMTINLGLALLFTALAGLAFWGLRRRRNALFV